MNPNDKSVPPPVPIWVPGIALLSGAIGAACTRLWKHVRPRTKLATLPSIRGHLDAGRQQITADRLVRGGLPSPIRWPRL